MAAKTKFKSRRKRIIRSTNHRLAQNGKALLNRMYLDAIRLAPVGETGDLEEAIATGVEAKLRGNRPGLSMVVGILKNSPAAAYARRVILGFYGKDSKDRNYGRLEGNNFLMKALRVSRRTVLKALAK